MDRNAGSVERWSETRRMERSRYIWRYGVLGWGLSVGVIWALVMSALQGWERLPILLPLALIGFPIGGYFFGVCTWRTTAAHREQAARSASETQHQSR
jgi:hypothetical protein